MSRGGYPAALAQNLTEQAHKVPAPVGFADIVEKVKPAVISVRVKIDGGAADHWLDRRPKRSAGPARILPPLRHARRCRMAGKACRAARGHNVITGQGSGFFISADGYAVTNNHVVEKAESVQVTTDDGKTHTAKVIGTDPRTDLALIKVEGGAVPVREARRTRRRASATGCSRSAIRSASAAP